MLVTYVPIFDNTITGWNSPFNETYAWNTTECTKALLSALISNLCPLWRLKPFYKSLPHLAYHLSILKFISVPSFSRNILRTFKSTRLHTRWYLTCILVARGAKINAHMSMGKIYVGPHFLFIVVWQRHSDLTQKVSPELRLQDFQTQTWKITFLRAS